MNYRTDEGKSLLDFFIYYLINFYKLWDGIKQDSVKNQNLCLIRILITPTKMEKSVATWKCWLIEVSATLLWESLVIKTDRKLIYHCNRMKYHTIWAISPREFCSFSFSDLIASFEPRSHLKTDLNFNI